MSNHDEINDRIANDLINLYIRQVHHGLVGATRCQGRCVTGRNGRGMNLTSKRSDEGNYFIQRENGEIVCMVPAGDFARPMANQIVLALNVDVGYILELLNSNALLNEAHMNLLSAAQAVDQSFDSQVWNIKSVDALKRAVEASKKALS